MEDLQERICRLKGYKRNLFVMIIAIGIFNLYLFMQVPILIAFIPMVLDAIAASFLWGLMIGVHMAIRNLTHVQREDT